MPTKPLICPFTGDTKTRKVFEYTESPAREIKFSFMEGKTYFREIYQFELSKHYVSVHDMDISALYTEDYVSATYKDFEGVKKTFEKIINLPTHQSDNFGRVKRVTEFGKNYFGENKNPRILDVGAGLGVFPYGIKQAGWDVVALDPDRRACQHIQENVGIETICSDFFKVEISERFDVITFNKVLEHVSDPIAMLSKAKDYLQDDGFVYIEIPDGEAASIDKEGKLREEFFIDHLHIFSFISVVLLAEKAGFVPLAVERLQEPSTKYTLRAFLKKR